jgi:hypothetical protein
MQATSLSLSFSQDCFIDSAFRSVPKDILLQIFQFSISSNDSSEKKLETYQYLSLSCKPWKEVLSDATLLIQFIASGMKVYEAMIKRIPVTEAYEKTLIKAWNQIAQARVDLCKDHSKSDAFNSHNPTDYEHAAKERASHFLTWLQGIASSHRSLIQSLDLTDIAFTPEMRSSIFTLLPQLRILTVDDKNVIQGYKIQNGELQTISNLCIYLECFLFKKSVVNIK